MWPDYIFGSPGSRLPLKLSAVEKLSGGPTQVWLVEDIDKWNYPAWDFSLGPVHSGGRNVLYLDGHADWLFTASTSQIP